MQGLFRPGPAEVGECFDIACANGPSALDKLSEDKVYALEVIGLAHPNQESVAILKRVRNDPVDDARLG
jgi:hypothetical protein